MQLLFFIGVVTLCATESLAGTCPTTNGNYDATAAQRAAALEAVTRSAYTFTRSFLKENIAGHGLNDLVCSPLSCYMALSMSAYGARGNTERQLRASLALPLNDTEAKIGFQTFVDNFANYKQVKLSVANKLFLLKALRSKHEFIDVTRRAFRSKAQTVNFNDSKRASRTINRWCAAQTKNRITQIIKPTDISRGTALILVSAVYFKGNWKAKFDVANTKPRRFYVDGTEEKNVTTMQALRHYRYGELPELKCKFVELPYMSNGTDDAISMFIVLPDERNGLAQLGRDMDRVQILQEVIRRGEITNVNLRLPKFKIESTLLLDESLKKLGLTDMFSDSADFTGIAASPPLKISKVIQKAFIEANEEGSEAAAVTSVTGARRLARTVDEPRRVEFRADHPFVIIVATRGKNPVNLFTARFIGR